MVAAYTGRCGESHSVSRGSIIWDYNKPWPGMVISHCDNGNSALASPKLLKLTVHNVQLVVHLRYLIATFVEGKMLLAMDKL